jgi:hypothetical protein
MRQDQSPQKGFDCEPHGKEPRVTYGNSADNSLTESAVKVTASENVVIYRSLPQMVLCAPCQSIFTGDPDRFQSWRSDLKWWLPKRFQHYENSSSFLDAVSRGCYICTKLYKVFKQEYEEIPSNRSPPFLEYEVWITDLTHETATISNAKFKIWFFLHTKGPAILKFVAYHSTGTGTRSLSSRGKGPPSPAT